MFSSTILHSTLLCIILHFETYRAICSDLAIVDASGIVADTVSGIHAATEEKREERVRLREIEIVSRDAFHQECDEDVVCKVRTYVFEQTSTPLPGSGTCVRIPSQV
jgi:hypothetical protein